ncbi:helix-turn-helix transcriptional regulator [Algiphilus sp.]|jgi:DNA-binding CsgD family transcriptional regulator/PAS domain-containing protein|uniref:helix-turn-helix transcriptional regulator n=2 Tax=Algiphilus sp. TaxID=1872431 RepID=UPI002A5D4E5E|nr:helix-turn-helix transcriptional regulator [Pseudomonadota bacterium]
MPRSQTTLMAAREAAHPDMAVSEIAQLTASEAFQSLDSLVGAIYDGALSTPPWKEAMAMVQDRLGAEHVTLMLRPPSPESNGVMINTGETTQQATDSYATRFSSIDPFVRLEEGQVVTAEEMVGKEWLNSTVYTEYLKPLGIRHLLGADLYTKDGVECRLRITRTNDDDTFTEGDRDFVRFLLPHLKRAIQLHTKLDLLETERQLFAGTINRMLLGIISYDEQGNIIETNEEARRILSEKDGIWLAHDALRLDRVKEERELHRIIRRACSGEGQEQSPAMVDAIAVTRPSGRATLGVLVKTVPAGEYSEGKYRPAAVVYLRDPEANAAQPSHELVRRLFGLTRMEATLALLLTEGLTLDEAAEEMNVRRNTARTHLRSIFCKTGVTRQTMLVRLLLNSVIRLG